GISKDELTTMAEKMQKMTGQSITVNNDTFAAADSDSDGSLNADELKSFMDKSGFAPPSPPSSGGMAMAVSGDDSEAKSSGTKGSSQKQIDLLQIMLEQLTKLSKEESKSSTSLLDVTA
ncbi:MAG: EF-hand domain-containing protein, partial [Desulfurivibrionaceae bacterium]